jgi:hypothetical protein
LYLSIISLSSFYCPFFGTYFTLIYVGVINLCGEIMSGNGDYLEQALDVGEINEDFDPMIPPATGEEYIQRVV